MSPAYDLGGTIRATTPANTLARLKPLLPRFGITRVANITGLDTIGIPVLTAVRPLARSLSVSQGKGVTRELATVSAIMEGIEVFHAEQRQPRAITKRLHQCKGDSGFIAPERLTIRSDANLSADTSIAWVEGDDLLGQVRRWIPAELFDMDFTKRDIAPTFLSSSNGLASGNTRTEAIVHGLCEAIERDQVSFWSVEQEWLESATNRRVIIQSIEDPACRTLVEKCLSAGLDIFVWHLAYGMDIPVFTCTIADRRNRTLFPQHATGYGCHPVATIALSRAITEAAQSRLTHISGLREDMTWFRYGEEFPCETTANKAWLAKISDQRPTVDFGDLCSASRAGPLDMSSLLQHVLESLRKASLRNAIVVDLAVNDVFSVIFACVPDLEYLTSKARVVYSPGSRMRQYMKRHGLRSDLFN